MEPRGRARAQKARAGEMGARAGGEEKNQHDRDFRSLTTALINFAPAYTVIPRSKHRVYKGALGRARRRRRDGTEPRDSEDFCQTTPDTGRDDDPPLPLETWKTRKKNTYTYIYIMINKRTED